MDLSTQTLYLNIYVSLTKKQKKAISYLYHKVLDRMRPVFPFIETIAAFADCDVGYVKKMLSKWQKSQLFVLDRIARISKKTNKQTSSQFILDEEFAQVYRWLYRNRYGLPKKESKESILKHWNEDHKKQLKKEPKKPQFVHPSPPNLYTPPPPFFIEKNIPHKDSFYRDKKETNKEKEGVNRSFGLIYNPLERIKLAHEAKIFATRSFSEHIVIDAIEAFQYQKTRNRIKKSDEAYFIGICKMKSKGYKKYETNEN